jgi:hypothetical protein
MLKIVIRYFLRAIFYQQHYLSDSEKNKSDFRKTKKMKVLLLNSLRLTIRNQDWKKSLAKAGKSGLQLKTDWFNQWLGNILDGQDDSSTLRRLTQ